MSTSYFYFVCISQHVAYRSSTLDKVFRDLCSRQIPYPRCNPERFVFFHRGRPFDFEPISSFGYFLGFYFYTMILGYLWLVQFSLLSYNHLLATISIFLSALAFLAPSLLITSPIRQRFVLSARQFDLLLSLILVLAAATVAVGAFYNFRLVNFSDIYKYREQIEFPALLRYSVGITPNALLPFAFACFVALKRPYRAGIALLLLVLFYPVTLTKLTLFASLWLLFLALLSRLVETRTAVILSLFLPIAAGVPVLLLAKASAIPVGLGFQFLVRSIRE